MTFEIEILEEKKNPLIDRTELKLKIEHFGEGTPNRLEIKKKISALQGAKEEFTIIRNIKTHYGGSSDIATVHIYETPDDLKYFEPFHIQVRNLPQETRSEVYKLKRKNQKYEHLFGY
ncbi:MAG: 30S ribosomal protein S24e [Candidatus Lokiarchaeota archaeon]|nr:30S ribosomal protein S24e [Candidatus Lokiarchaeota archaeon]MBD3199093.1 30S ribosomal protein S24e [Candidatus Lokiarchaeota archaeon]